MNLNVNVWGEGAELELKLEQTGSGREGHDGDVDVDDPAYQPARLHHHWHLGCVSTIYTSFVFLCNVSYCKALHYLRG